MSLFGQSKRPMSARRTGLPLSSNDTLEKPYSHSRSNSLTSPLATAGTSSGWLTVLYVPIPPLFGSRRGSGSNSGMLAGEHNGGRFGGSGGPSHSLSSPSYYQPYTSSAYPAQPKRHFKLYLPIPHAVSRRIPFLSRPTPLRLLVLVALIVTAVLVTTGLKKGKRGDGGGWTEVFGGEKDSVVLTKDEISRIWEWEVLSGHHPSLVDVPESVPFPLSFSNPATPSHSRDDSHNTTKLLGEGPIRDYLPIRTELPPWERDGDQYSSANALGFPPRPVPGSVLDLDKVLAKCDFTTNMHVRDCLEYLRIGGHLDNGRRFRRANLTTYEHIYKEDPTTYPPTKYLNTERLSHIMLPEEPLVNDEDEVVDRLSRGLSRDPLKLPTPFDPNQSVYNSKSPCDPLHPRIFHMFWAGPFTDKPYMAVLSFLFTQNLGLDQLAGEANKKTDACRPQFWVWINPGPAASIPNPSARREMYESLAVNPWSAPFLHARFQDVVKFKMWNTTEQMDWNDELRDHWREMPIFNSGGHVYGAPQPPVPESEEETPKNENEGMVVLDGETGETAEPLNPAPVLKKKGGLFEQVGSTSQDEYDRLSVILSDLARFIITHRYGGIYVDADTVFLRDWEELWNWKGQFAYRWSFHEKYNTAVLKLHKGSALGKFLFKTALENGLDFHPMTITTYLKDAGLDALLFRIPDALFDSAWLNMEGYQRDRPPFPYFPDFSEFFSNNKFSAAGPHPLGYDGFFRGSFSYHFHNFWWLPFDPSRNWPDLGKRFLKGERTLRQASRAAKVLAGNPALQKVDLRSDVDDVDGPDEIEEDEADLSWSTALKRTFEAYIRSERPNMYGEWLRW